MQDESQLYLGLLAQVSVEYWHGHLWLKQPGKQDALR